MQTIIMTVGTSLRSNTDRELNEQNKRPWAGKHFSNLGKRILDKDKAVEWMAKTNLELISAETNTLWRLDPKPEDEILLLHSDTVAGLECAEVLKVFFEVQLHQTNVKLEKIPGIDYDIDESGSALERMARLLEKLLEQAKGIVTLAATGGFKAETMIMALIGNSAAIPVCYVHEDYKALIYLPLLASSSFEPREIIPLSSIPDSSKPRSEVVNVQESRNHHRPKSWKKVKRMLENLSWTEYVRFDDNAFSAPKNGVKSARSLTSDGRYVFWIHLYESEDTKMAVSVETTGYTQEHSEQMASALRQKLAKAIS
jgi:putative CRISPR-associated protein (TIGR02619 family)